MKSKNISEHISWKEGIKSMSATRHGIDNTPTSEHELAMRVVAEMCFEPIRDWHGLPIGISSFYRSPELNVAIGGAKNSQHSKGEAMDIDADVFDNGITNREIFDWLLRHSEFDQLIGEYPDKDGEFAWVHVSYVSPAHNRGQVLIAKKNNGKTAYETYIDGI